MVLANASSCGPSDIVHTATFACSPHSGKYGLAIDLDVRARRS